MGEEKINTFESIIFDMIIKNKHIDVDKLCEGVCTSRYLYYAINSERIPDYSIVKRITERLEYDIGDHEVYLSQDEYEREVKKNDILASIVNKDLDKAYEKLELFSSEYIDNNVIEKQFVKVMQYQIWKMQGISIEILKDTLDEAIRMTMPFYIEDDMERNYYSITEINLLIERIIMDTNAKRTDYQTLIRYIETSKYDEASMVKIYPKLIYHYITFLLREDTSIHNEWMYCERAIDMLRNQNKLYFLLELLSLKSEYKKDKDALRWKKALERVYIDNGIDYLKMDFCYLYFTQQLYSINEVICDRRKVLGISQTKLSEGICSLRTLQRIEAKKTSPQREVANGLFNKLGLTTAFFHQEFLLENTKLKGKIEKWRKVSNEQEFNREKEIFDYILQHAINNSYNEQSIMCEQFFLKWKRENMDAKRLFKSIVEVIGQTIDYEIFKSNNIGHLTKNELRCLNLLLEASRENDLEHRILLRKLSNYFDMIVKNTSYFQIASIYDWIMCNVASEYGNTNEFAKSNEINEYILKKSLLIQNAKKIPKIYYANWWNKPNAYREKSGLLLAYDLAELFKHEYQLKVIIKHMDD